VVRRAADAGGGKSGALNLVLQQLEGRWMLVLDADAQLQHDTLERLRCPFAEAGGWAGGAVPRKAVANADVNLLDPRPQAMEMALDAVIQQGRLGVGGVAELRGNGQLLRREAVLACGGFNEAARDRRSGPEFSPAGRRPADRCALGSTGARGGCARSSRALLRQRQRWAEGGLQRFLDYGPGLLFTAAESPSAP
jgi:1,2-diacylglycerol 3-beta-glucosyltransferase